MGSGPQAFPSYEFPPVVEVAMSVEFDPLPNLDPAHLGEFWAKRSSQFPKVRSLQPISPTRDEFRDQGQWLPPSLQVRLLQEPLHRLQMASKDEQWLWQLQPDRLVVNWRKQSEDYPRYDSTLQRFQEAWTAWSDFLQERHFGKPEPRVWHVTYVNRIPAGEGELWESPADWPAIFPGLWGGPVRDLRPTDRTELQLHGLRGLWIWTHQEPRARLVAEAKPGRSQTEPPEDLLVLSLRAWGPVSDIPVHAENSSQRPLVRGFDLGHELIVRSFDSLASEKAQSHWKRL